MTTEELEEIVKRQPHEAWPGYKRRAMALHLSVNCGAMIKRGFDIAVATAGLLCLSPVFAVLAILIKLDSSGPVFFRQERVGRRLQPFIIYKFRTMKVDAQRRGGLLTLGEDPRITRIGRLLRRKKLDELPQLINVLRGEMSIVGPRPEVPAYVEPFRNDYEEILQVRPGITDVASVMYYNEAVILGQASDPDELYRKCILPAKLKLSKEYVHRSCLAFDLIVILKTLAALTRGA